MNSINNRNLKKNPREEKNKPSPPNLNNIEEALGKLNHLYYTEVTHQLRQYESWRLAADVFSLHWSQ